VVEGSPAAAMVDTAEVGTTVGATVADITLALVEEGIAPDQVRTAVAAPTEPCAAARPLCTGVRTILGPQRATLFGIPRPDGIPSNDRLTVAQCPRALVQPPLAGLGRKPALATTRRRPMPPLPTDNGTASQPRTQPQLWHQTVP